MNNTKKRIITLLLAFVMVFACVPEMPAKAALSYYNGEVLEVTAPNGVNMHLVPSTSSSIIVTMEKGSTFCILSVNSVTGWLRVVGSQDGKSHTGYMVMNNGWYKVHEDMPQIYPYTNKKAVVQANILNVHNAPNEDSKTTIGVLGYGNEVNATGYTMTGWTEIEFPQNGKTVTAYVSSNWVTIKDRTKVPDTPVETFTNVFGYSAQIKTGVEALNIHRSPNVNAEKIAELFEGRVVTILSESKSWYKITLNVNNAMETGYILKSYCNKIDAMKNIYLDRTSKTLKVGKKYHILVRGTTGMSYTVKFTSANKKIAKVTSTGYVTAKKAGTTKITCHVKVGSGKGSRAVNLKFKVKVKKK